mgnify:CR=1 FL=1
MKKFVGLILPLLLAGCGMSEEEQRLEVKRKPAVIQEEAVPTTPREELPIPIPEVGGIPYSKARKKS